MSEVLVVAEHLNGVLADITFEMLGKARELAAGLGGRVTVALLGSGVRPLAEQLGAADSTLLVEDPALEPYTPDAWQQALTNLVGNRKPALVVVANTGMGMDLAAGLSAALDLPLAAYCTDLRVDRSQVVATSQVYAGKLFAESRLPADGSVVSVLSGAFPIDAGKSSASAPSIEAVAMPPLRSRVRFKQLNVPEAGDVDITREQVLVSVGRGIQEADNIALAEELAAALGGAVSASRPIIDNGWLPRARQVGKSGMKVKPRLYVAVGISGAPEHLEGMRDAELIVAINTDPKAPIFDVAHYGTTADLFELLPALTDKIRALRAVTA
jgi:electron transfer flavoprotein alpha subunit